MPSSRGRPFGNSLPPPDRLPLPRAPFSEQPHLDGAGETGFGAVGTGEGAAEDEGGVEGGEGWVFEGLGGEGEGGEEGVESGEEEGSPEVGED